MATSYTFSTSYGSFFSNLIFWVQYNSKYISFEDPNFTVDFPAFSWQPNTVL